MLEWIRRIIVWLEKYSCERNRFPYNLDFSGNGKVRVDAKWLVKQPKVQAQVRTLRRLIEDGIFN